METTVKEIILGSLLGDGSLKISKGYVNARFSFRHSLKQKEYFFWKVNNLRSISSKKCFWYQDDGKIRYQSLATKDLTELYYLTHRNEQFEINKKWLDLLTPLSLAVWWMDDGSITGNGRKGVFSTNDFNYKDQLTLSCYLKERWKIKTKIGIQQLSNEKYYRLCIYSSEELKRFLRIILPYIPIASMLPKVILLYRDLNLQQRWISEVCNLSNFSEKIIMKYWKEKVLKRKDFRKRYSPSLIGI